MYISQCISRNKSITQIYISKNNFDDNGYHLIERGQDSRRTRLSALQLVAMGKNKNEDALTVIL